MLESELKARGISFNEEKKQIRPLKALLKRSSDIGTDNTFVPMSMEIIDAIKKGKLEAVNK